MPTDDARHQSNLPKVVLIYFGKNRTRQLYTNITTLSSASNKVEFLNSQLIANPNSIVGVFDENHGMVNGHVVEKIVDKFIKTNFAVKAIYADSTNKMSGISKKKNTAKINSPIFFANPASPIVKGPNIYQDILDVINQQYIVYYYPEVLFNDLT